MLKTRIIPCLQLIGDSLVKAVRFSNPAYIGDPVNTVRIFNELEVDELCFLDIRATIEKRSPNLAILEQIANECFMPLSYGGGVSDFNVARQIMSIGFEKLVLNTQAFYDREMISRFAGHFGSQAIVASIDARRGMWGRYTVYVADGSKKLNIDVEEYARELQQAGAGEILLTAMDREGTWSGYDTDLIKKVAQAVSIPVIANGGAGTVAHIREAVIVGKAAAVGLGSMVVYQQKGMGVLISFPDKSAIEKMLQE